MTHYDHTVDDLLDSLSKIQDKLQKKIIEIANSKETSMFYWSGVQRDIKYLYESMRNQFAVWVKYIPKEYYKSISDAIKDLKALTYKTNIKITDLQNTHTASRNINILLNDSVHNFMLATNNGEKRINQAIRATQQINIAEKDVNEAISENKGTTFYAKRALQEKLIDSLQDGQVIKVIDKNGDERNYNVKDYAEMVARTKLREAQTAGVMQTAMALDEDLVQVSPNPGCDECNDYAGKIFSISGNDSDFPSLDDDPPYHPNCRHSLTIYIREFQPESKLQDDIDFSNEGN